MKDFSFKIEKGFSFLNCQICPKTIFERFGTITEFAQKTYLRESEPYANLHMTIFEGIGTICEFAQRPCLRDSERRKNFEGIYLLKLKAKTIFLRKFFWKMLRTLDTGLEIDRHGIYIPRRIFVWTHQSYRVLSLETWASCLF